MTYRETFRRHRRLLTIPIVLAVVLAVWTVAGAPKAYESTASVWVDSPPPEPTSLNETNPSLRTPADQQQLLLAELLRTRGFRLSVGQSSPLAGYLRSHASGGWGPTALLRGGSKGSVAARIVAAFGPKQVTSIAAGPQVLQVTFRGPTPAVAAGTLGALLNGFSAERLRLQRLRDAATASFYKTQADSARSLLDKARAAGDRHGVVAANGALQRATRRLQAAQSDAGARVSDTGMSVIDPPRAPSGPVSGHKKLIMALFGGLFAGGLIAFLGVVALTPSKPSGWDEPTPLLAVDDERERRQMAEVS